MGRAARLCMHLCRLSLLLLPLAMSNMAFAQTAPAAAGNANSGPRHGVGLGFGEVFMTGDLNTNFSNGVGFNLNYSYESTSAFGLLVNLHVNNHGNSNPNDSLSLKGITPNLKMNLFTIDHMTLAIYGGVGLYMISEQWGTLNASFKNFAIDAGAAFNVDLDPHFRFGPSIQFITLSEATDSDATGGTINTSANTSNPGSTTSPGVTMSGRMFELMFNVMYFF